MSTKVLNIHEAKTHLSEHLAKLKPGDRIVLCRRNEPIAEIRPLPAVRWEPRPVGGGKGLAVIPPSFFEPLPDELVDRFSKPQ
jgi:antitoxin (DNA-binding transcriptional repressor) of toxin-antitoxin stability system